MGEGLAFSRCCHLMTLGQTQNGLFEDLFI